MHAKRQRDFAAMVQVVFHHMPDHPATSKDARVSVALTGNLLPQFGKRIAGYRLLHHLPGCREARDQFARGFGVRYRGLAYATARLALDPSPASSTQRTTPRASQ